MSTSDDQQAVIIYLRLSDDQFGAEGESFALYDVEEALGEAVKRAGELDGHEIGGGFFTVYVYGSNADAMLQTIARVLARHTPKPGSYVLLRRGPPGSSSQRFELPLTLH